jgi:hypothetical protein
VGRKELQGTDRRFVHDGVQVSTEVAYVFLDNALNDLEQYDVSPLLVALLIQQPISNVWYSPTLLLVVSLISVAARARSLLLKTACWLLVAQEYAVPKSATALIVAALAPCHANPPSKSVREA